MKIKNIYMQLFKDYKTDNLYKIGTDYYGLPTKNGMSIMKTQVPKLMQKNVQENIKKTRKRSLSEENSIKNHIDTVFDKYKEYIRDSDGEFEGYFLDEEDFKKAALELIEIVLKECGKIKKESKVYYK
jgi:predicted solute-binding protein